METDEDKRAFQERLRRELRLRCLMMAAWHSARSNIDVSCSFGACARGKMLIEVQEIADRKEAQLVEKLSSEVEG